MASVGDLPERLRRPAIDVYLLHNPAASTLRRDDLRAFLRLLRTSGQVRAWGASVGDVELIRLLTLHGADPHRPKADGFTPLMAAAFRGQLEAVKALVEAGAKIDAVNTHDPANPFSALDLAVLARHQRIVDYFRERGAAPSSRSRL